jgi:hypothetical protein
MTSTIRVRERVLRVVVAGLMAGAAGASADLIVLTDGATIKVESYEVVGNRIRLALPGGGSMTFSIELVDRAIPDEVLAADPHASPAPPAGPPTDFTLRFVDGHEQPDTPYGGPIWETARRHGLNPQLIAAVAHVESRFNPRAVSAKGARGLLQVMPATGRRLGFQPAELYDPLKNLDAGARYLRQLADRYADDVDLVLAAYNAGEGAVARFGGVPPFRETRTYLDRVYAALGWLPGSGT